MPAPLIPLIGAGAALLGQGINAIAQGGANRQARRFSVYMYNRQRADALADWATQNEYNSPAAQMQRLREAELNPNLVYGSGADAQMGGPVRSSSPQSWTPKAPQFAPETAVSSFIDTQVQQATIDNLVKQGAVLEQEKLLKGAQTLQTSAEAGLKEVDLKAREMINQLTKENLTADLDVKRSAVDRTIAETRVLLARNEREAIMQSQNINESVARIYKMRVENAEFPYKMSEVQERTLSIMKDQTLKQLDIDLKKKGIQPHDPLYQRRVSEIVDEIMKLPGKAWNLRKLLGPNALFGK